MIGFSLQDHLNRLRDRIFAGDNRACYVERERALRELAPAAHALPTPERYPWVLCRLLQRLSTPVGTDDVFLGRMVEARSPDWATLADLNRGLLPSRGHLTLDWPTLLNKGLSGVAAEAQATAKRLGTAEAADFATCADACIRAVAQFAQRYAAAVRKTAAAAPEFAQANLLRAADALDVVPDRPAYDVLSALQSVWFVHLVTSCCIGRRDFAFGRMDRYLLPFYERGIADGSLTRESATTLLAHFLMKANEITGTATWNHAQKPIPCQSSKQYLMLAGRDADGYEQTNDLTELILDAAKLVRMPQPVLTVCMDTDSSDRLKTMVAAATPELGSQIHVYNDRIVQANLRRKGLSSELAAEYTMGGCCRLEIGGVTTFLERHDSMAHWLLAALNGGTPPTPEGPWWHESAETPPIPAPDALTTWDAVLDAFRDVVKAQLHAYGEARRNSLRQWAHSKPFHFESLLLRDCVARGKDCDAGGTRHVCLGHYFDGIATVADSLYTIKTLVFDQRRFTLPELLGITARNFAGHEALREEILHRLPKFGNDHEEVDACAARAARIVLDALDEIPLQPGQFTVGGFYSLHNHHHIGRELPATPDGRLAGQPISENQSPTYGTDTQGITALLKSVARLPLERTPQGGLNVTFGGRMPADTVRALLDSYFAQGGLHVGFTFMDRETLQGAQAHPERYRTLTVRMYGFSEYFTALSPHEQNELIERTRY
jgi:formate C-acetyltransferase